MSVLTHLQIEWAFCLQKQDSSFAGANPTDVQQQEPLSAIMDDIIRQSQSFL